MRRKSSRRAAPPAREYANVYEEITAKIIADLTAGCFPWAQPWQSSGVAAPLSMPNNAATGRSYSGINVLILWGAAVARGYSSQSWLTLRQALTLGGCVRKGERGTTIVYADRFVPESEKRRASETGDPAHGIPFLKRFTVFSVDQCDGLPPAATASEPVCEGLIAPEVEALLRTSGADLRLGGDRAFYSPGLDYIQVPRPEAYFDPVNWHRTALHELGHWTGHPSRIGRDMTSAFGTEGYAREELIAEICAAFCCATLGILPTVRHADYIGSWLEVLREDSRAIVRAASAASKAADYILSFRPEVASGTQQAQPERLAA